MEAGWENVGQVLFLQIVQPKSPAWEILVLDEQLVPQYFFANNH